MKLIYSGDDLAAAILEDDEPDAVIRALRLAVLHLNESLSDLEGSGDLDRALDLRATRDRFRGLLGQLEAGAPA